VNEVAIWSGNFGSDVQLLIVAADHDRHLIVVAAAIVIGWV
jgi:hypothetical protein